MDIIYCINKFEQNIIRDSEHSNEQKMAGIEMANSDLIILLRITLNWFLSVRYV
jgi:hypothetical protein